MIEDFEFAKNIRLDLETALKSLCCDPLTFMWKNSLLSPRDQWFEAGKTKTGTLAHMRFIMGFRVRRHFMFFQRDTVLYRCPFCSNELVIPLGYTDLNGGWMNPPITLAIGYSQIKIEKTLLERELAKTKKRCKTGWPPKD